MPLANLIKLGKEIAPALRYLKQVKAIAFYGAIAQGFADEYSDIDLMCLCSKIPSADERTKVLTKFFKLKYIGNEDSKGRKIGLDLFMYKGKNFGIEYQEISDLVKRLKLVEKRGFIAKDDEQLIGSISNAKIVWDPAQVYANLKKKLAKFEKKPDWLVKLLWNRLINFSKKGWPGGVGLGQAILRKNHIWAGKLVQMYTDHFLLCLYAINNKFYTDMSQKWAYKEIATFKHKPKGCVARLEKVYLLGNKPNELKAKIKLFSSLIKDTTPLIEKKLGSL